MSEGRNVTMQEIEGRQIRHEARCELLRQIVEGDVTVERVGKRALLAAFLAGELKITQCRLADILGITEGRVSQRLKVLRAERESDLQ